MYKKFFKSYTEKVWGIPCNQIGAEFAEQRIKGLDIIEIIKSEGVEIIDISTDDGDLEDVFIKLIKN